jgi:hypothetical protein
MVQGHRKGPLGENEVVHLLSDWWGQVEPGCQFKRTPKSGGWGNADVRGDFKVAGDICTTSQLWPFTIEVKRRESWSFGSFAEGRLSPVWKWWRQCIDAAAEEDRIPLLWARKNRRPWIVLLPERLLIPLLVARDIEPDITFARLSARVDDGDIRPACILGDKFLQLPPQAWLPKRRRAGRLILAA